MCVDFGQRAGRKETPSLGDTAPIPSLPPTPLPSLSDCLAEQLPFVQDVGDGCPTNEGTKNKLYGLWKKLLDEGESVISSLSDGVCVGQLLAKVLKLRRGDQGCLPAVISCMDEGHRGLNMSGITHVQFMFWAACLEVSYITRMS